MMLPLLFPAGKRGCALQITASGPVIWIQFISLQLHPQAQLNGKQQVVATRLIAWLSTISTKALNQNVAEEEQLITMLLERHPNALGPMKWKCLLCFLQPTIVWLLALNLNMIAWSYVLLARLPNYHHKPSIRATWG